MQKSRPEHLSGGSFIDGPVEWHRCNHALRIINFSEPRMFEPISPPMRPTGNRTGEGYADEHQRTRARSVAAICPAPSHHPVGGAIQTRQVLYARQHYDIGLGGLPRRACFGAIKGIE